KEHHHSGPWTPTQPDRVGHPATSGNRNHHRDKKSELDQAGTPRSRKIEASSRIIATALNWTSSGTSIRYLLDISS
ncbi:hypothetical protein AB4Z09_10550, partial [Rhodococcus sp. TAF43]|uniref:hypothetical protein n=1 Tax=Rhodococcus sp. TAF43 TaxID=3237483 RepID=UPI003F9C2263